jgi:hypothetical protein
MTREILSLTGHNMNVIVTKDLKAVAIRCNEVVEKSGRPALSGRDILLRMTPEQAMTLLQLLQKTQTHFGFEPMGSKSEAIAIPPAKDRN